MQMTELTVHAVEFDAVRYRSLLFDVASEEEFAAIPDLNGWLPLAAAWRAPRVLVDEDRIEGFEAQTDPDIWHLSSMGQALVMQPSIVERLQPFLTLSGELLPLRTASGDLELQALNVLNVLRVEECIDLSVRAEERAHWLTEVRERMSLEQMSAEDYADLLRGAAEGDPWPVLYPDFVEAGLGRIPTFFRVDRLTASIFLLDRDDEDDTLLRRLDRLGITGLTVRQVWSSQTGAEDINFLG
jgi:hypothetical protein